MQETPEHTELRRTVANIVDNDINPFVDEWEAAEIMPLHDICKKLGQAGVLGISKPAEFGGMDLDYSFEIAFAEEMGHIKAQGPSTAIGVQTNMATPALPASITDLVDLLVPELQRRGRFRTEYDSHTLRGHFFN